MSASKTFRVGSSEDSDISLIEYDASSSDEQSLVNRFDAPLSHKVMRVILVQTADGLKPPSGGYRGNYAMLHALAVHGHQVAQLCWAYPEEITSIMAEAKEDGKDLPMTTETITLKDRNNNETLVSQWIFTNQHGIHCIALDASIMVKILPNEIQMEDAAAYISTGIIPERIVNYVEHTKTHIGRFNPTHVLFNDALTSKVTSTMSFITKNAKRVEIIHTFEQLPLGPFAGGIPGSAATAKEIVLWKDLDGIITVSKSLQTYAEKYNNLSTVMIPNHPWVYKDKESYQWPRRRFNFSKKKVVMINPAEVKGYCIFKEMVDQCNLTDIDVEFVAYKGWGTTSEMVRILEESGVCVLDRVCNIEPVYDNTTILIMPSLWQEAWGIVATEAQLRGIVVMSSDVGGIREAKRYVHPILPVNPIDGTKRGGDGKYTIPHQIVLPWITELVKLLTDEDYYRETANAAYFTTRNWVKNFDPRQHEKYLFFLPKKAVNGTS